MAEWLGSFNASFNARSKDDADRLIGHLNKMAEAFLCGHDDPRSYHNCGRGWSTGSEVWDDDERQRLMAEGYAEIAADQETMNINSQHQNLVDSIVKTDEDRQAVEERRQAIRDRQHNDSHKGNA